MRLFLLLLLSIFLITNLLVNDEVCVCTSGQEREPTAQEYQKISQALFLFRLEPDIPAPSFRIKEGYCVNAWADYERNAVVVSKQLLNDHTVEELAGLLGHEFGHLVLFFKSVRGGEHWRTDIVGAELVGKELIIKQNRKQIHYLTLRKEGWLAYLLPLVRFNYTYAINDYDLRIKKVAELTPD